MHCDRAPLSRTVRQEAASYIAAHPVPVEGPAAVVAELTRLLRPPPDSDTGAVAWKWDVLRDFGAGAGAGAAGAVGGVVAGAGQGGR